MKLQLNAVVVVQKCILPFASHLNFLDQQLTEDGKPYGPIRYKEIIEECCIISKNLNTPYNDVLNISPTERNYMIRFLIKEAEQKAALLEKARAENAINQKKY